ncbi:hypothetical protein JVU11DRAFT_2180 [Chiua virens]|nr:hypothetical protein JVU11DRAFT_12727 [Chiua virens]KAG9309354.1 hypothetical protein JVU11DRAFT_10590 [Chiua virens]KAG9317947.1 hypothetical protein JVU11DRAFT_2180 [Chiua virens]
MASLLPDNIGAVITNNLVLFRSIPSLQEQNQKLLKKKIVRELGAKMEAKEREYHLAAQLERQKKSSEVTIHAYMKERDTLKAMLARAERSSLHTTVNGDVNGAAPAPPGDLVAELEDAQAQFESHRVEIGLDTEKLREDLVQAQRQLGQANAALAKATAKVEFLDGKSETAYALIIRLLTFLQNVNA